MHSENISISNTEVWDGLNYVNGIPHGAKWKPLYAVTVNFETALEAQEFVNRISGGIHEIPTHS